MAILISVKDKASKSSEGLVRFAQQAEASLGLRDDVAMTPALVKAQIDGLSGNAPANLNSIEKLAEAINNDPDYHDTVDAQVANLQSQINTLSGTNLGNLTTEIDAIEAGSGLNSDGTFTAPTGTNFLGSASSLKNADTLLDAQIKTNADAIATLGNGNLSAIQTEIDAIESSVGIASDGTLGTYANANNYSGTASIKAAIEGVDAQVAANTTAIAGLGSNAAITALQSELDASQSSIGLSVAGAYVSRSGSEYIDSASSIVGEITLLDAQIKTNEDAIALKAASSALTTLAGRVTQTESDITSNDTDIAANVSQINVVEASVGLEADGSYAAISGANYATSSSTLKAAVGQLDTQIKSTQDDLDTLETTVSNLQTGAPNQAEVDAIEASVGINTNGTFSANTGGNFIASASSVRGEINALDTQLNTTQGDLDTAEAAIVSNTSAIGNKADASGLSALTSVVDTVEASVGLTTSGGFTANSGGNYISGASSVRGEINALDTQVATNAGDISNLSSTVSTLSSAGSTNASEITALENEIDATQAGAGLGTTGAYAANSGSNYLTAASSLKDADNKLDAQIKTNETAIALKADDSDLTALTTRVTSAEGNITSNDSDISSLQSDVTANTTAISNNDSDISTLQSGKADTSVTTALQTELDATQAGAGLNANGSLTAPTSSNYLGSITTLKGGLSALDTQIKSRADDIASNDTDIAANASDISDLESLADTHESAVGLSASGSYVGRSGSNYLDSATSVVGEASALDTQVKTNEDAIAAETSARQSADSTINSTISTLQSEVDATQTGAGLTSAGAYTANTGATYIASATSLKDADDDLDAAIAANASAISSNDSDISSLQSDVSGKASSSSVSALQTEVDATQAGVGLGANGSYSAISGANYATSSSNLKAAVEQLDTQLKSTQDDLDTAEADIASLNTLQTAQEAAIGLSTAGAYVSRSGSNYLDSASSVVGESSLLDAQIKTNETAIATKASSSSLSTLQTEVDGIEAAVGLDANGDFVSHSSTNYIDAASSIKGSLELLDTAVKARETAITAEAATRLADDNTLSGKIDTVEASVGLNTDGSLTISGTNFINGQSSVLNAVKVLDTNVNLLNQIQTNIRASAGTQADGTKTNYSNTNYISNSDSLKAAIEALDTQVSTNASSISSLGSSNIAALQTELDATQAGAGLDTDGDYTADASSNYLQSATSLKDADDRLDAQIKTNEDAIATKANSTTLSALDLRVTQLEIGDGGVLLDHSSDDAVEMDDTISSFQSKSGPFQINFATLISGGTTDLVFFGSKGERDGDRHFAIHPVSGDAVFAGKHA
jgi:cell division protein FtsB